MCRISHKVCIILSITSHFLGNIQNSSSTPTLHSKVQLRDHHYSLSSTTTLSLNSCSLPCSTDPFHISPAPTCSGPCFHPTSCVNTATLPLPLQFLSIPAPQNFLRLFMHFLIPSFMLLPKWQFLTLQFLICHHGISVSG